MHATRLNVILNDNDMSIAPPVGAVSAALSRAASSKTYLGLRATAAEFAKNPAQAPEPRGQTR